MGYSLGRILLWWILLWLDTFYMVPPQGCISPQATYLLRSIIPSGQLSPMLDTPLARYLLWLDTSFGQILLGQIPSTWYLLRAAYLLRQHISSGQLSPQVNYPLRQLISSGTIFVLVTNLLQYVVFPQLHSFQAVSIPLD